MELIPIAVVLALTTLLLIEGNYDASEKIKDKDQRQTEKKSIHGKERKEG
jgi:hypothetical protein